MSEPITVPERIAKGYTFELRSYTYEELLDIFNHDDGNLVRPLVLRCQAFEADIARLSATAELPRADDVLEASPEERFIIRALRARIRDLTADGETLEQIKRVVGTGNVLARVKDWVAKAKAAE